MSYVCERISKDDWEIFNFDKLGERISTGGTPSLNWAIDRNDNIWLRRFQIESNHITLDGGYAGLTGWDFYWKGALLFVELQNIGSGGGIDDEHRWSVKKLVGIDIPERLESKRSEILSDLEKALSDYTRRWGASSPKSYKFTLQKK